MVLDTTLSAQFAPGTNLLGNVAGANWTFLLPGLELKRVLSLGVPHPTALQTLSGLAEEVVVLCGAPSAAQEGLLICRNRGLGNVVAVEMGVDAVSRIGDRPVDLVVVSDGDGARRLAGDTAIGITLRRLLGPDGLVYLPSIRWSGQRPGGQAIALLSGHFGMAESFWLTPLFGAEAQTFVPLKDHRTATYFLSEGLDCPSLRSPSTKRMERFVSRCGLLGSLGRRCGLLLGPKTAAASLGPPAYLRALARQAGVDLDGYRWGLSVPGKYASRKVLFLLFEPAEETPRYIVKLTRGPQFNSRLENEYRALNLLKELGIGNAEILPQPAFLGHHAGMAIVGETIVRGTPFRQKTSATVDCPHARAAIDVLTALGQATIRRVPAALVADRLEDLLDRFVQVYHPTAAQQAFLAEQIATIRDAGLFPTVFQHGDPGPWNMLVTPSGRVGLLDWEAAEPQGMPLWDVFYFLRSHCLAVARRQGVRNRLKAFARNFDSTSPLCGLMAASVRRYADTIGLAKHMVGPLFHTCWMHRAIKEATRLPADKLPSGHFVELLRFCIDHQPAAPSRWLAGSDRQAKPRTVTV